MSLFMYDGAHRWTAALAEWEENGLDLPVDLAVQVLEEHEGDEVIMDEIRARSEGVAVPEYILETKQSKARLK